MPEIQVWYCIPQNETGVARKSGCVMYPAVYHRINWGCRKIRPYYCTERSGCHKIRSYLNEAGVQENQAISQMRWVSADQTLTHKWSWCKKIRPYHWKKWVLEIRRYSRKKCASENQATKQNEVGARKPGHTTEWIHCQKIRPRYWMRREPEIQTIPYLYSRLKLVPENQAKGMQNALDARSQA